MMERYDIMNEIVNKYNLQTYLEIGVRSPWECFDKINCSIKMSVDPGIESDVNYATHPYYSDDFFKKLENNEFDLDKNYKWDLIFIDGLHLSEQCYRDFINSMNHISENGFVVFHDANPPTIHHAREDYKDFSTSANTSWNGTVWKSIQKIRTNFDLDVITVDSDWGVTVVRNKRNFVYLNQDINPFYEYNTFSKYRKEILNLKNIEEFKLWV